jgi:hypothetical protein
MPVIVTVPLAPVSVIEPAVDETLLEDVDDELDETEELLDFIEETLEELLELDIDEETLEELLELDVEDELLEDVPPIPKLIHSILKPPTWA